MPEGNQRPPARKSNVICLPSCGCSPRKHPPKYAGGPIITLGNKRLTTSMNMPDSTRDRIAIVREYLTEIRDLVLRIETIATIEEKSYGVAYKE